MRDWLELMLRRTGELAQRLQHVTPTPTLPVAVRLYVSTNLYAGLFDASASSKPDTLGWSGGTPPGVGSFFENQRAWSWAPVFRGWPA
jgi:hypothetical protein